MRAGPAVVGIRTAAGHAVPIERASAADLALLAMESGGVVPEHLGAVLVLDAGAGFDVESVRRVLAERVRAVPRLRQRLVRVPAGCGRPVWVDDPGFDAARHVQFLPCPDPNDEQALLDVAAVMIIEPLPRSRPLWAAALVPGVRGGRVGLVLVLHHVLADGIGGLAVLGRLVDGAERPGPAGAFPQPRPARRRLAAAAFRSRLRGLARFRAGWRELPRSLAAGGGVHAPRAMACSILQSVGPRRRFAVARAELAGLRTAAHRHGGTVNEVLLTAVAGALHTLLARRGERIGAFRIAVMVAGRRVASADTLGNQVAPLLVGVPGAGAADERLTRIVGTVRAERASPAGRPPAAVPQPLLRVLAAAGLYRLYMNHQRRLHTLVSNVHGPDRPLTLAGAPIAAVIPVSVAEAGNLTVTFVALSYAGTLTVTIIADPANTPSCSRRMWPRNRSIAASRRVSQPGAGGRALATSCTTCSITSWSASRAETCSGNSSASAGNRACSSTARCGARRAPSAAAAVPAAGASSACAANSASRTWSSARSCSSVSSLMAGMDWQPQYWHTALTPSRRGVPRSSRTARRARRRQQHQAERVGAVRRRPTPSPAAARSRRGRRRRRRCR